MGSSLSLLARRRRRCSARPRSSASCTCGSRCSSSRSTVTSSPRMASDHPFSIICTPPTSAKASIHNRKRTLRTRGSLWRYPAQYSKFQPDAEIDVRKAPVDVRLIRNASASMRYFALDEDAPDQSPKKAGSSQLLEAIGSIPALLRYRNLFETLEMLTILK